MSTSQENFPESKPKQESPRGNSQSGARERNGFRIGLALASAVVSGAVKAVVEYFLKDNK
ncbi:hypothetical protein ACF053_21050 [Streptomyces kanasensis]|uniref:hypothetical protein n=1 Tax=Streptomyces kanasensis TaxID=936756 RepID=UPI0036FCA35F